MSDGKASRSVDVPSSNERECAFLVDVLEALLAGQAPLTEVTRRVGRYSDSYDEVWRCLLFFEERGFVGHKSSIKRGRLIPEYFLTERGHTALRLAGRKVPT